MTADPGHALKAAIDANDAAAVARVLDGQPGLKAALDDPLPGGAFGGTALLAAVSKRNREMIDVLLRAGAGINARSHWWAGGFGVLDGVDPALAPFLIERGATVDASAAAGLGLIDRLRDLIAADPEAVHARGGDGQTPLHVAANVDVARLLLDRGADIDARDVDHESTAAQYAVRDRQDVTRYLIARGCRTDVLMASAVGDLDLVRAHLDRDPACIRTSVSAPHFPMQDARAGGTIYIWTLGSNRTAHLVARDFGHDEVFRLLMERTPPGLRLAAACEVGDDVLVHALVTSDPGVARTLTDDERRRLADAAQENNTTAVRLMLSAGWPVDARGQHRLTALQWAAWHGNPEMVTDLLRHGAAVDEAGDEFDTPPLRGALHGSLHSWHRGTGDYGATVEALLAAGATPPAIADDLAASPAARAALDRHRGRGL